jgi:simple sugar transport system permease protein
MEQSRFAGMRRSIIAIALGLAAAAIVIAATGGSPLEAFRALLQGFFGDLPGALRASLNQRHPVLPNELYRSLGKATPLLLSGLAVALALRAGLFNIGAEGQLLVGGLAAAWAGFAISGLPAFLHLPLALAAGMTAGALWGFIPGLLKSWRGAHEVIVTIMLNYVAIHLTHYLVTKVLIEPPATNPNNVPRTPEVLQTARLWAPDVPVFSSGFFLALLAAVGFAFLLRRTALGFEIRAAGLGPEAARTAGIPVGRTMVVAMMLSGALAGLAGAVEVLGNHHRFFDAFSPGYGFDSIAVALLGGLSSLGVTLSAVLFGGLSSGALQMEAFTDTPRQITGIIQAVVILAVASRYVRRVR